MKKQENDIQVEKFGWDREDLKNLVVIRYDKEARSEVQTAIENGQMPDELRRAFDKLREMD